MKKGIKNTKDIIKNITGLKNTQSKSTSAFTLVELLIVVSLIIIIAGVTSDIVITLIRSYSKTQIANEIEQNANFALNKMEKELRGASSVDSVSSGSVEFTQILEDGSTRVIKYSIVDASSEFGAVGGVYALARSVDGGDYISLTNYTSPGGVTVDQSITSFEDIGSGSNDVVRITLSLKQIGNPSAQFTQNTTLEKVVVLRGSY